MLEQKFIRGGKVVQKQDSDWMERKKSVLPAVMRGIQNKEARGVGSGDILLDGREGNEGG